jgi:hypothetical protein
MSITVTMNEFVHLYQVNDFHLLKKVPKNKNPTYVGFLFLGLIQYFKQVFCGECASSQNQALSS